ncbi:MAG: ABC transporter substrate-binding protein [Spirochaetes bacterium]|nr:ABC transporter substrate-binding protein [Spirochaetota bacterium]
MKKILVVLLTVLLLFSFAACKQGSGEVKLGGIFPLSGGAATFGQSSKNGMQMAIDEFNAAGHKIDGKTIMIKPIYGDTEGQPEKAANVGQKLINQDQVIGIVGAVMSKNSLAIAPIAQAAKVPMISPTSTNPKVTQVGDYIYRACFIDPFQGTVMAKYAYDDLGKRRAALLYDNGNDYNKGLAEFFKKSFAELGGEIVAEEAFTDEDKTVDFKAQLTNIKTHNPDFIYIPNYYQAAALIMKQAAEIGLEVQFGGGDGWDSPELVNIGGKAVESGFFSNHFSKDDTRPIVQTFVKDYTAKFGATPDALATLAYDATKIFLNAMVKADSLDKMKIRDAMKTTSDEFVAGKVTFDSNRNPIKSAVVLTIKDGQQMFVKSVSP